MKKRDVIGRRIVDVNQERGTSSGGETVWNVLSMTLDNGAIVVFSVVETEGADYYLIDAHVYPKNKEG